MHRFLQSIGLNTEVCHVDPSGSLEGRGFRPLNRSPKKPKSSPTQKIKSKAGSEKAKNSRKPKRQSSESSDDLLVEDKKRNSNNKEAAKDGGPRMSNSKDDLPVDDEKPRRRATKLKRHK